MTFYVLHSPYPDGSWRGWEKCLGAAVGDVTTGVLVFNTLEEAEAVRSRRAVLDGGVAYWTVWPIEIDEPLIRSKRP